MTNANLAALSQAGVAVWLDDLSRELVQTGRLAEHVEQQSVVGVTSNPTIFATALKKGDRYEDQVRELAASGADVDEAVMAAAAVAPAPLPATVHVGPRPTANA